MYFGQSIAAVIPAYDESAAIGLVVDGLKSLTNESRQPLFDQIIVCDNASNDDTGLVAKNAGAEVVYEARAGYGSACLAAMAEIRKADVVVFVDGDDSVRYQDIPQLLDPLIDGADLVIGSRALGVNESGALTPQQKFGNWLASWLIRRLWQVEVTDLGPLRAIRHPALQNLQMSDPAFGWTVEMQVKAIQQGLVIQEVATGSRRRIGRSKISGTIKGTVFAAIGIFGTIFRLYRQQRRLQGSGVHG